MARASFPHLRKGRRAIIQAGELSLPVGVTLLAGFNGAGKTTLLSALSQGETSAIWSADQAGDARPRVVYMPQFGGYVPHLTVEENLKYVAILTESKTSKRPALKPETLMQMCNLTKLARLRASRLSGGQQRSLSLACALMQQPNILLLDEPTTGLDFEQSRQVVGQIRQVSLAMPVLVATHDFGAFHFALSSALWIDDAGNLLRKDLSRHSPGFDSVSGASDGF